MVFVVFDADDETTTMISPSLAAVSLTFYRALFL